MDDSTTEAIARRAGLQRAIEAFPDDVAAAAVSARKAADRIRRSAGPPPELEPWPPMAVRT